MVGTAVLVVAAGWGAAPTWAAQPTRVSVPIQFQFQDEELSAACGFQVLISAEGSVTATLHDTGGTSALEVDHQMMRWTYEAPSTGGSYTYRSTLTALFEYPEGPVVGAPATVVGVAGETVVGTAAGTAPVVNIRAVIDTVMSDPSPAPSDRLSMTTILGRSVSRLTKSSTWK